MIRAKGWVAALLVSGVGAYADTIDYQVTDYAPASIKIAGDGTVFVDYVDPVPGMTYHFHLNVWVEAGGAAAPFPTTAVPVKARKLSGDDLSGWFSLSPSDAVFTGYGQDPAVEGQPPSGAYVPILVSVSIPSTGLPAGGNPQVKIQADTAKIPKLGDGHGIIVRFSASEEMTRFTMKSWLTDSCFVPMACAYDNRFRVVTHDGIVRATNPGGFYYNVLVCAARDVSCLTVNVLPLDRDFGLKGANAVHVFCGKPSPTDADGCRGIPNGQKLSFGPVSLKAGDSLVMTVHMSYVRCTVAEGYLPKIYAFSASAASGGKTLFTSARMIGERKVVCCCEHHEDGDEDGGQSRSNGGGSREDGRPRQGNGNSNGDSRGHDRNTTHGNNGVGNGEDPEPPGHPRVNDGAGTRPGEPGNRGGSNTGNGNGKDKGKDTGKGNSGGNSGNTNGNGNSNRGNTTHGNNGVGNGTDPQPPGNPPTNDGAGTGRGNPGNRGGAHR